MDAVQVHICREHDAAVFQTRAFRGASAAREQVHLQDFLTLRCSTWDALREETSLREEEKNVDHGHWHDSESVKRRRPAALNTDDDDGSLFKTRRSRSPTPTTPTNEDENSNADVGPHETLWHEDGNIVLVTDMFLYRVHCIRASWRINPLSSRTCSKFLPPITKIKMMRQDH